MSSEETGLWRDPKGRLWVLADSGIDTEIFELVGDPVFHEAAGLWYQQVALRIDDRTS